jgi:hypothetical protein
MPAKKKDNAAPLAGTALVKEVCRRIRVARGYWDAHNNRACCGEREKALTIIKGQTRMALQDNQGCAVEWMFCNQALVFGSPFLSK